MSRTNPRFVPAVGAETSSTSASTRRRISQIVLYVLLVGGALIALLPMLWMLSASLMPTGEASTYPPHFFPSRITFAHYGELFTRLNLGRYLFNSAFIAVVVTGVSRV